MTETERHKQLKLLGGTILRTKGFLVSEIIEEHRVSIGNKNFIVDVCGLSKDSSIAVECGNTNSEKLVNLKLLFDEVIHLPYGITSLQSDLRDLIDVKQTEINSLNKDVKKLKHIISERENKIRHLENVNKRYSKSVDLLSAIYRTLYNHGIDFRSSETGDKILSALEGVLR